MQRKSCIPLSCVPLAIALASSVFATSVSNQDLQSAGGPGGDPQVVKDSGVTAQ